MSGGGDKGSYEASVFIEFTNLLSKEDVSYDVVTGASAGSLNGAGLSLFAPGDEEDAAIFIYGLWNSISTKDILEMWDEGLVKAIFNKGGIFNNQPLIDFLYKQIGLNTIRKKFTVVLTNAETGHPDFVDYNSTDVMPPDAIPTIVGSSALPFAFPPMHLNNNTYIDGGSIWNLNVAGAVRRCKEVVDNDEDIILDILVCSMYFIDEPKDFTKYNAFSHLMRMRDLQQYNDDMQDIIRSMQLYPKVNFRYVVGPSEVLSNSPIPLDFSKDHLDKCFAVGKKDARNAIQLGEGGYRDLMIEYYQRTKLGERLNFNEMVQNKLNKIQNKNIVSE